MSVLDDPASADLSSQLITTNSSYLIAVWGTVCYPVANSRVDRIDNENISNVHFDIKENNVDQTEGGLRPPEVKICRLQQFDFKSQWNLDQRQYVHTLLGIYSD